MLLVAAFVVFGTMLGAVVAHLVSLVILMKLGLVLLSLDHFKHDYWYHPPRLVTLLKPRLFLLWVNHFQHE